MPNEKNIHFVNKPRHTNPADPTDHPGYREMVAKAPERMAKMAFENDAEKRDYMRRVAQNPNNVPGLPAFFPPLEIKSHLPGDKAARTCQCGGCAIYTDGFMCPRCERFVATVMSNE